MEQISTSGAVLKCVILQLIQQNHTLKNLHILLSCSRPSLTKSPKVTSSECRFRLVQVDLCVFHAFGDFVIWICSTWVYDEHLVEKPIKTIESLSFDYTKPSPVALVPLRSSSVGVIPYGHIVQMTISLTMPDSEYNNRLGVFQVRVKFLSANGDVTTSSSHPCMLQFKSLPVHYTQTFLRSAPLIAGIQSETQVLNIKIDEHTGLQPTASLKVILEQRAEFHHDGGIPQIYAGSLHLQSELPQLKRLVLYWRRTLFIWTSIVLFLAELVFILAFFRPVLVPRGRQETIRYTRRSNIIFRHKSR
ncbi:hypothetical protein ACLB2K_025729 [Fragaria x ananassa]